MQRVQKAVLDNIRDAKVFDSIRRDGQKRGQNTQQKECVKDKKLIQNCIYCGTVHLQK